MDLRMAVAVVGTSDVREKDGRVYVRGSARFGMLLSPEPVSRQSLHELDHGFGFQVEVVGLF